MLMKHCQVSSLSAFAHRRRRHVENSRIRAAGGFTFKQVTREGKVSEPALAQLTYGALLQGRCAMVADAGNVAKKALTIALRYAAVRRQFKVGNNEVSPSRLASL